MKKFQRTKRFLLPSDDFFLDGNLEREAFVKHSVSEIKIEELEKLFIDSNNPKNNGKKNEEQKEDDEENQEEKMILIECQFPGCESKFYSIEDYQNHYDHSHRNTCYSCGKIFPSEYLLDLHVRETHDTLFKLLSKRKPSYKCFVETCNATFWSPKKRAEHLVHIHNYPEKFFGSLRSVKKIDSFKNKVEQAKLKKQKQFSEQKKNNSQKVEQINPKKKVHQWNYKKKKQNINEKNMEIEEISNKLSKIHIPDEIHFGMKRGLRKKHFGQN
ncbi:zinc finger protein [Anaeramoeba ignava]|uniref:Zinc finger protein n=1 Tax=Anaeramoeba ignava TaxID=1746090 RepID=A0A9Q0R6S1_ANAIG|nr:zinc finger protein [Anaeramoeba ignava]